MIYVVLWYSLIGFTLFASLAGFLWGLKNGQFEDQQRVSYLPLRNLPPAGPTRPRPARRTLELYVMGGCALLVLAAIAASIIVGVQ